MRMPVKQQVLLAPATIFVLLIFLLIFMQYSYWSLVEKRQELDAVGTSFSALAEADMAARRPSCPDQGHAVQQRPPTGRYGSRRRTLRSPARSGGQGQGLWTAEKTTTGYTFWLKWRIALNPTGSNEPEQTAQAFAEFRAELSSLSSLTPGLQPSPAGNPGRGHQQPGRACRHRRDVGSAVGHPAWHDHLPLFQSTHLHPHPDPCRPMQHRSLTASWKRPNLPTN